MEVLSKVKSHAVLSLTVVAGVYFVTPMIRSTLNSLPIVGSLGGELQAGLMAGIYAMVGAELANSYHL